MAVDLFAIGGVAHHQVAAVGHPVDDQVVEDGAALVAANGVQRPPGLERSHVVRHQAVQGCAGAVALQKQLTHVRDVEEPHPRTHSQVLVLDALVLDRHLEAGEGYEATAQRGMAFVQWGALQRLGHAAGTLNQPN